MQYDIFVQDVLYKTITTESGYNVVELNETISSEITSGKLIIDETKPLDIRVVKK